MCNFTPTVGFIAPTNADSNIESVVGANLQSASGKEVSDDELAGVCKFFTKPDGQR